jgi:hypothetical protein
MSTVAISNPVPGVREIESAPQGWFTSAHTRPDGSPWLEPVAGMLWCNIGDSMMISVCVSTSATLGAAPLRETSHRGGDGLTQSFTIMCTSNSLAGTVSPQEHLTFRLVQLSLMCFPSTSEVNAVAQWSQRIRRFGHCDAKWSLNSVCKTMVSHPLFVHNTDFIAQMWVERSAKFPIHLQREQRTSRLWIKATMEGSLRRLFEDMNVWQVEHWYWFVSFKVPLMHSAQNKWPFLQCRGSFRTFQHIEHNKLSGGWTNMSTVNPLPIADMVKNLLWCCRKWKGNKKKDNTKTTELFELVMLPQENCSDTLLKMSLKKKHFEKFALFYHQ